MPAILERPLSLGAWGRAVDHFENEIEIVEKRVENARLQLEWAQNYRQEVERDLASGLVRARTGEDAYQRALRAERLAREHHQQALKTLNFLRRSAPVSETIDGQRHSEPHHSPPPG